MGGNGRREGENKTWTTTALAEPNAPPSFHSPASSRSALTVARLSADVNDPRAIAVPDGTQYPSLIVTQRADPYRDFAERYDAFDAASSANAPNRKAFFRTLFEQRGVRRVLDCACGTGSDLLLFHSLGCAVVGSDLSEAMLAQAREKLEQAGVKIPLVRADFRELPFSSAEPFDAVTCLSTSLPHLLDDAELGRALSSIRAVLRDRGVLILDQGLTDRQLAERPRFIPVVNTNELSRVMVLDYGDRTVDIHVLDLIHRGAESAFHVDSFTYRILLRDDYGRLLREAGFRDVSFYGGLAFEPYSRTESGRLILVAER
jgi:glycine/sarcosine N-methyltransferase